MPVSQNNKYKNMLITHKKTIDELQEKVRQFDDTEVNKLKAHIMLLRKQNDEHVKNNNDLNNECRSLKSNRDKDSKNNKRIANLEEENDMLVGLNNKLEGINHDVEFELMVIKDEFKNVANELAFKFARLQIEYEKISDKKIYIQNRFTENDRERGCVNDLLRIMKGLAEEHERNVAEMYYTPNKS